MAEQATLFAHVRDEAVRAVHEALVEQHRRAVPDQAVALHLAEPQPAIARAPLGGLAREHGARPARARVHLVHDHVLELLVVDGPEENVGRQRLAGDARGDVVLARVVKAVLDEHARTVVNLVAAKGRAVAQVAVEHRRLAREQLHHLAHRHARGEAVRVHDDVGRHPVIVEGHVLVPHDQPAHALLPVARRELVAELGRARRAHADLDDEVVVLVGRDHHAVDVRVVVRRALVCDGRWPIGVRARERLCVHDGVGRVHRHLLVDEHVSRLEALTHRADAVLVEHAEALQLHRRLDARRRGRRRDDAVARLVCVLLEVGRVLAHHDAPAEAAVERGAVEDERVLDVVTRVGHHGDHCVVAGRQLGEVDEIDRARLDERLVRVDEQVEDRVDALRLVTRDCPHGLLAHRTLVGVARRLVVVRVGDEAGADAQDCERVDLEVRGARVDVPLVEGDLGRVLLVHVEVFDEPLADEVLPVAHPFRQLRHVLGQHSGAAVLHHDQRPADTPGVGCDVDRPLRGVQLHRDELAEAAAAAQAAQGAHKHLRVAVDAKQHAVDEYERAAAVSAEVEAGQQVHVLHSQVERQPVDWRLVVVRRHVRCERQVLDQAARLPLGRVRRAEHAPLRRLQRARSGDFARLLELGHDARHHAERRDEGEARENLRHA
mmetsp:Transcript_34960/g.87209  ORF Transcript_34960/g.87209 Transcript_34960/m.87209 type:complete len:662 (-) Transcript_34960:1408-3393(-)